MNKRKRINKEGNYSRQVYFNTFLHVRLCWAQNLRKWVRRILNTVFQCLFLDYPQCSWCNRDRDWKLTRYDRKSQYIIEQRHQFTLVLWCSPHKLDNSFNHSKGTLFKTKSSLIVGYKVSL